MADTTETRWYKIVTTTAVGFATGAFIANSVYFNRIRTGTCNAMTSGEANVLMWINIILAVVFGLHFLWSAWRLIFAREFRTAASDDVKTYFHGDSTGLIGHHHLDRDHHGAPYSRAQVNELVHGGNLGTHVHSHVPVRTVSPDYRVIQQVGPSHTHLNSETLKGGRLGTHTHVHEHTHTPVTTGVIPRSRSLPLIRTGTTQSPHIVVAPSSVAAEKAFGQI